LISAASNPKIKNLVNLIGKAKTRREQDVFVTEGVKMFLEAEPERIKEIYVSESFSGKNREGECREKLNRLGYEVLPDRLFSHVSDTQTPQGILCVIRQYHYKIEDMLHSATPLLLILEDIQDPGNLGTIVRTAEGAGVHGIIMSKGTVDICNPKTIRSTMGSIYRMPFLTTEDIGAVIRRLQQKEITTYAAHLKGREPYYSHDFTKGTAFLIGNEGKGLKDATAAAAGTYLYIPMCGQVESLNAAVASSILMYEAARQRCQ
jgi:TrmH family RNA methyltransferase